MNKHTPGPWHVSKVDRDWVVSALSTDAVDYSVAYCQPSGWHKKDLNHKANAHLIAAAPDLLEALKSVINAIDTANALTGHLEGFAKVFAPTLAAANAAIAKAEGQQ